MDKRRREIQELNNLDVRHLENMFIVKQDKDGRFYYDLTDTLVINPDTMNPLLFEEHEVTNHDSLYSLSQRYYDTSNLWWLIGVTNDINNPFDMGSLVGKNIKIPIKSVVGEILTIISG